MMTQLAIGTGLVFSFLCLPEPAWAAPALQDPDQNLGVQDEKGEALPGEAVQSDGLEQKSSEAPQAAESSEVKTESAPEDMAVEKTDSAKETGTPNAGAQDAGAEEGSAEEGRAEEGQEMNDAAQGKEAEETADEAFGIGPLVTLGFGASSMALGATLVIWGIRPLVHYYQVQSALEEEELRAQEDALGATQSAVMLQNLAYALNKDWKMRGAPLVVGGSLLVVAGTLFVGAGVMGFVWNEVGEGE